MSLRYWLCGLIGVVVCAAAAVAVTFATYGLTSHSLCTTGSDQLACDYNPGQLAMTIVVSILVAIPIGGRLFAWRKPSGGAIGGLAISLAFTGAAAAALVVGIGNEGTSAEAPGLIAGAVLAAIAPIMLLVTMIGTFSNLDGGLAAKAQAMKAAKAKGGRPRIDEPDDFEESIAGIAAIDREMFGAGRGDRSAAAGFGGLAAQLAQIAAARSRTADDGVAAKLRQLDDLRASGLLTPEEHERKRRELLDSI